MNRHPFVSFRRFRVSIPALLLSLSVLSGCAPAARLAVSGPPHPTKTASGPAGERDNLPPTAHVVLYRVEVVLDAEGREIRTIHRRYRIDDAAAIDQGWATTGAVWAPWHEAKPSIKVVVEGPDGAKHALDPATIEDAKAATDDDAMYSDRRVLRAPIPAIEVGSIVDETVVTRTTQPLAPRAASGFEVLGDTVGTDRLEIAIDAPESLPLTWKLVGESGDVRDERKAGRRRITLIRDKYRRTERHESYLPDDAASMPYLRYATGESWQALATHYAKVVDAKIAGSQWAERARAAVLPGDDTATKARKLTELVQAQVRYTGLELGESAIVPHTPSETLERRYGDCKDQASLLVALLRAVGVEAHVALLNAGGIDADPALPSLDAFDHAIVYVAGARPLWIDPTDHGVRPGTLGPADEGRLALIASSKTRALARTPESSAAANVYKERREVWLPAEGAARLVETDEASGLAERSLRAAFGSPEALKRESAEKYVKSTYGAEKLASFTAGVADDLSRPFTLKYDAIGTPRGFSNDDLAELVIEDGSAFSLFPASLLKEEERDVGAKLLYAHRSELEIVVHAEDAYEAAAPPADETLALGPASLTRTFERLDDRTLRARIAFALPKRTLGADELRALREAIAEYRKRDAVRLRFPNRAAALAAAGKSPEALALLRARAERPDAAYVDGRRYTRMLSHLKLIGEAQRAAAQLHARLPDSTEAASLNAALVLHDPLGRTSGPDVRYAAGRDLLEKIVARDAGDGPANEMIAETYIVDDAGRLTMDRARLQRARAAAEASEKAAPEAKKDSFLLPQTLLRLDDVAAARTATLRREEGEPRHTALLAIAAIQGGEPAVTKYLDEQSIPAAKRGAMLLGAGQVAASTRHYKAALLLHSMRVTKDGEGAGQLAIARALVDMPASEAAEIAAARAFCDETTVLAATGRKIDGTSAATPIERDAADELSEAVAPYANLLRSTPLEVVLDLLKASYRGEREGQRGELALVRFTSPVNGYALHMAVVKDGARHRLLARSDWPESLVGRIAAEELKHGREERVRSLLDWYFGYHEPDGEAPTTTPGAALWRQTADVRLTAAAMNSEKDPSVVSTLAAARERSADREVRIALDSAIVAAGMHSESVDATAAFEHLRRDGASAVRLRRYETYWRAARGDFAQVEKLLADPTTPASVKSSGYAMMGSQYAKRGKVKEAYSALLRADDLVALGTRDANNAAWYGLLAGHGGDARVLELGRRAAQGGERNALHTLATIEAGYHDVTSAQATLARMVDALGGYPMRPIDALPTALLAERHGLADEAIRLLEPIAADPSTNGAFARERLEALRKGAKR